MQYGRSLLAAATLVASLGALGFDISRHGVPPEEILSGGPPKDGIPALDAPRFVAAAAATFLLPDDRIIGVDRDGVAKAYPIRFLNWHEAVNDTVGTKKVVVTYCPLTASGVVFDRVVNRRTLSFGVSGRLYQSNVLLYDRQTESLWSQLKNEAVTGEMLGLHLRALPSTVTTWTDWRQMHPNTLVLSLETGYLRDYGRDPYEGYHASPGTVFPVKHLDSRLPMKEKVLGVHIAGQSKAYPFSRLGKSARVHDRFGGMPVRVEYDRATGRAVAVNQESKQQLPAVVAYWFAWSSFHPETGVWEGERSESVR